MYNNVNVAPSMGSNMPFPYENAAPMMGANMPFPHENIAPNDERLICLSPTNT